MEHDMEFLASKIYRSKTDTASMGCAEKNMSDPWRFFTDLKDVLLTS